MVIRSPISARTLITLKSKSMWYDKKNYRGLLHQDLLIELYVMEVLRRFGFICSKVIVKRSYDRLYCFLVVLRKTRGKFFTPELEEDENEIVNLDNSELEESNDNLSNPSKETSWEDDILSAGNNLEDSEEDLSELLSRDAVSNPLTIKFGLAQHLLSKESISAKARIKAKKTKKLRFGKMLGKRVQKASYYGAPLRLCLVVIKEGLSMLTAGMKVNLFCVNSLMLPELLLGEKAPLALWEDFSYWHRAKWLSRLFFSVQAACFSFSASMLVEALSRVFALERRQSYIFSCVHSLVLYFWSHAKYIRGVKVVLSGTIDGQDRATQRVLKYGKLPVNTLDVQVDYAAASFFNVLGAYGLRVFIFHGTDPLMLSVGETPNDKVVETLSN